MLETFRRFGALLWSTFFLSPVQCRKYEYSFDLYKAVQLSTVVTSLCSTVDDSFDQCNIVNGVQFDKCNVVQ